MFLMGFDIQIGKLKLRGLESVTVESNADALADTCTITLPGAVYNLPYAIEEKIKRGDAITVKLGYDGQLQTEFTGYLKSIRPNTPMTLECEDSIYLFRKPVKDKVFAKTNAIAIIRYVLEQINGQVTGEKLTLVTDITGMQFDKFTIIRSNGYEVLEKIKSETGLAIYCRGNDLHCHLLYTEKRGQVTYDFARNIEDTDDLEYVRAEDVQIRVKVIGRTKKGGNIDAEVGEKGGDLRTFQRPTISDKATLESIAKQEQKKLSFDGYKGAIKGWLVPFVGTGYSATVIDTDYPNRAGTYYAKAVKTEFSASGGRRTVSLGIKVAGNGKA